MARSKHRKHTVKHPANHRKKGESKTAKKNSKKAALVMMAFFGLAGLAVGYLLAETYWGIAIATVIGLIAGLIVNKLFSSAATEE